MTVMSPVPTFYLYGEPHRSVSDGFVHVEALDDRSRPSEWAIKPHSHAELSHVFLIATGGGRMRADDRHLHFVAPCLLVVPAATIHGFEWHEESAGTVITVATRYVADLTRHEHSLVQIFSEPRALALSETEKRSVLQLVDDLMRELGWSAPGHRAAVDAAVLSLLIVALRKATLIESPMMAPRVHVAVVARFRERIERRFRLREKISVHAAALGVSETALRVACARVANASPAQLLDDRAMLEARRMLLYSTLSVAEIAYSLGFADPAYFSRFFSRHAGVAPSQVRNL